MKLLILGLFVGALAYSPIYLFETQVQPELEKLKYQYSHADEIANKAVGTETYSTR